MFALQRAILLSMALLGSLPTPGVLVKSQATEAGVPRVLIFTATTGFRHDSIPTAIRILKENQARIGVTFDDTEDNADFTDDNLARYDGLVFVSASGEPLDGPGKAALQTYFNSGGNFVGIHSASDCMLNTTFYVRQLGATFDYHADLQEAIVNVIGPSHPSTSELPEEWTVNDEMYNFRSDPRDVGATVILSADESSYSDTGNRRFDQGSPHPIAWYQERGAGVSNTTSATAVAGRSFYTSLGHLNETWEDPLFLSHVLGGINWALQSNTTRASNLSALVGNPERVRVTANNITGSISGDANSSGGGNGASNEGMVRMKGSVLIIVFSGLLFSCLAHVL